MAAQPIIDPRLPALLRAQGAVPDAPPAAPMFSMAAPPPQMGNAPMPLVSRIPTQTENDTAKLNSMVRDGSGIDQIDSKFGRIAARTANTIGTIASVFAPPLRGALMAIPGTNEHHQLLVHQQRANVANDNANDLATAQTEDAQAQTDQRRALATQEQAKANRLDDPTKLIDSSKTVQTDDGVYQMNPQTGRYDVRVGDRVEKPKSPEQTVFDAGLAAGKSPQDALSDVYNAKNVKDATTAQMFANGYRKAHPEASDMDVATATIKATQTDPRVTVINAAAADRQAGKNAGLDVSDPAMQASVQAVANGSLKLSDVFGRGASTAQKAQFAAAVKAVNPNYNSGDHDIENHIRNYMIAGKGGQTLTAFNTAQSHLEILRQASDELQNGNSTTFNSLAQAYAKATGDPAPTDFNAVKNAVKGEIARALTGNVTVSEQAELDKDMNEASSPRQVAGVAHKYTQLIEGKKTAMRDTYTAGQKGEVNFGNSAPKDGDTKSNSHGDKITYRNGKWGL